MPRSSSSDPLAGQPALGSAATPSRHIRAQNRDALETFSSPLSQPFETPSTDAGAPDEGASPSNSRNFASDGAASSAYNALIHHLTHFAPPLRQYGQARRAFLSDFKVLVVSWDSFDTYKKTELRKKFEDHRTTCTKLEQEVSDGEAKFLQLSAEFLSTQFTVPPTAIHRRGSDAPEESGFGQYNSIEDLFDRPKPKAKLKEWHDAKRAVEDLQANLGKCEMMQKQVESFTNEACTFFTAQIVEYEEKIKRAQGTLDGLQAELFD